MKQLKGLEGTYAIADDILVAGTGDTMRDAIADHDRSVVIMFVVHDGVASLCINK